jgi:pyridoxamine 5'-phosphate oxidase
MKVFEGSILVNNVSYNLEELEKDCWIRLIEGSKSSKVPFHLPAIANIRGGEVTLRTVVLRKVIPELKELRLHTDIRSPKWNDLLLNPQVSLLFYDDIARIQLRIKGHAILHYDDAIAKEAWQNTSLSSRKCYLTTLSPSSHADSPTSGLPEKIEKGELTEEESEMGQQNFGVVAIVVNSIDWLWLNHAGHRRACFDYERGQFKWMIP